MREPDLVFEFQTRNGWLWQVTGWRGGLGLDLGQGRMEVRAIADRSAIQPTPWGVPIRPAAQMIMDEAADPQVTVNGIIDWLEEIAA